MLATNRLFKASSTKTPNLNQPTPKVNSLTRRFNSTPRKTDIYCKRALGRARMFAPKTMLSSTRSFSVVRILTFHMTPCKANSTISILERGRTAASTPNQLSRETLCLSKDPLSSLQIFRWMIALFQAFLTRTLSKISSIIWFARQSGRTHSLKHRRLITSRADLTWAEAPSWTKAVMGSVGTLSKHRIRTQMRE